MKTSISALLCLLLFSFAGRSATFTRDTTIDFNNHTFDGDTITVTNCTLTVNGAHTFAGLNILSGGVLTHQASDSGLFYTGFATNEDLQLNSTNPTALSMTNVQAVSITVANLAGTIVYTNNVDYMLVFSSAGVTSIERTSSSSIPDGAIVSVTYSGATLLGVSGLNLTISGNLLLQSGGAIDVAGRGYNQGFGPGKGSAVGNPAACSGGGYGGMGGLSASNASGGVTYGLWLQPTDKGSEGGALLGPGGSGGGAIYINVGGSLQVNGLISANGANAINERTGGGSGGSIWLTAQLFSGSGSISADGGDGEPFVSGGGGGGRIALYSQTSTFNGVLSAKGGRGFQNGGAGTVYVQNGTFGLATVDNGGRSGATTPLSTTQAFGLMIKRGAIVTLPSVQTINSLLLVSNGWISLSRSTLNVLGDVAIQGDSGITADATGYLAGAGPGAGRVLSGGYPRGGGGGYGGSGGNSVTNALGGGCYGFIQQPTDFGSGGGNGGGVYPNNLGGSGGGAVLLNVSGTLFLYGTISANGGAGIGQDSGGGAGGSIWLNLGGFSGSGTISACGGLGNDLGGSGGGGRIAVYYQVSDFSGIVKATGAGLSPNAAGAGTIYTKLSGQTAGQLLFDNGGQVASVPSLFSVQEPVALTIQGGAVALPTASINLGTLLVNANSSLRFSNTIQSVLVSGDATVNAGGAISSDAAGSAGIGLGRTFATIIPGGGQVTYGGGGGYGGLGGYGGPTTGGATYGSPTSPAELGSAGAYVLSYPGAAGGGGVRLTVNGSLNVNGRVSCDGASAMSANAGGGSGGSIVLTVGNLTGAGIISANGGAGNGLGGGGGGGRIAITYANTYFSGIMRAYGGSGGANGGPGTIYLKPNLQQIGQLVIDNGGSPGLAPVPTAIYPAVNLVISGGAVVSNYLSNLPIINNLTIASNSWMLFTSSVPDGSPFNVTVNGNATIESGGGIRADGAGSAGNSGQGAGREGTYGGSGGGYGGYGGPVTGALGGSGYGLATSSPHPGSGGGNINVGGSGGAGGGSISLNVYGLLILDGRLSADGNSAALGFNGGGGSGGSVSVNVGTIMGAGTISASGGNGDNLGGGGGGGRLFIFSSANLFLGSAVAYGGNGYSRGGAGTVFYSSGISPAAQSAQIIVDNGGLPGTNTYISDTITYDLAVRGGALVSFLYFATLHDLSIASNSWIVFYGSEQLAPITVSGSAYIDAGGGINADSVGFRPGAGPGAGPTSGIGTTNAGSGGGYGGYGGAAASASFGGKAYGSATNAPQSGSGGGGQLAAGGAGGGAITLRVTGSLTLDGLITANGGSGVNTNRNSGGGGSGGGIYISAAALFGNGAIRANGGNGIEFGGGGGGGRIMLFPGIDEFSGTITAYGGNGFSRGGAGTVYTFITPTPAAASGFGQILVDNGGVPGTNTLISDPGPFDLTIRGGGKSFLSSLTTLRNLYVASNAWLFPPTNSGLLTPTLNITSNAIIESGGTVLADGLGNIHGSGPGAGSFLNNIGNGAGYGGYGGIYPGALSGQFFGGSVYGSISTPNQVGSGGGGSIAPYGGSGGGLIILNVTGVLDVDGVISAKGLPGGSNNGGGSGGSVWLTAGTLLGNGIISANGGDGAGLGGGGGGGRIALISSTNSFAGQITAYGGAGSMGGGAGTIYIAPKTSTQLANGQVIIDNGGRTGTNTSVSSLPSLSDLIIRNAGVAQIDRGQVSIRNLIIQSNAWLKSTLPTSPDASQFLVGGNATVSAGGGIIADGTGAPQGSGLGAGRTATSSLGTAGGGGGYGGAGGSSGTGGAGGATYGSPTNPFGSGSGAGETVNPSLGGPGGGGLGINIMGTLQLDGRISANGGSGLPPGGGGGSGGTVNLKLGKLAGAGVIAANGGNGDGLGGGGGGGRVRVAYTSSTFAGSMTAYGGTGANNGGAGTVYVLPPQPFGRLIVDNGGTIGTNTPLSVAQPFGSLLADLIIQNGAIVSMLSPQTYWSNLFVNPGGTLTAPAGPTNYSVTVLRNALIETGGAIVFDGLGFTQTNGPGGGLTSDYIGSGAGYGGVGGASSLLPGGPTYGSAQQPTDVGSGGGLGWGTPGYGSQGGGAVHLAVGGTLTVNGQLSANGDPGLQEDAGGGSGGSVWIESANFSGDGLVSANGGAGELYLGGGGGGGRIAVYSRANYFFGQITASGGAGYNRGQDGSIYLAPLPSAPTVIAQSPSGVVTNPVGTIDLYFNEPLYPETITITDFVLVPPPGAAPPQTASLFLQNASHVLLQFFPAESVPGAYTLLVGPGILDLFGQPMSQVYTGSFTVAVPSIQGTVADMAGRPLSGVLLQPDYGLSGAITDTNGQYVIGLPYGASTTVTPSDANWTFVPGSKVYTNVIAAITNENYLAVTTLVPPVSAQFSPTNMTMSWLGIPGVTYQPLVSINLVDWVPYGPPFVGTNGVVQLVIPIDGSPQNYFRLRANN